MRKNFGAKSYLYPMPVLLIATYDENGQPDIMNAAWGSISDTNKVSMYLTPSHKTVKNIKVKKAFTVSVADESHVVAADYVGIASGNTEKDKVKKSGFHVSKSEFVDAPVIDELPMVLECTLDSINSETDCVTGTIVNVGIDESVLDKNGNVDFSKFQPITFDPVGNNYVGLGKVVGKAFSDGNKLR